MLSRLVALLAAAPLISLSPAQAQTGRWATIMHPTADVVVRDVIGLADAGGVAVGTLVADGADVGGWAAGLSDRGEVVWTRVFDERLMQVYAPDGVAFTGAALHGAAQAADGLVWAAGKMDVTGTLNGRAGIAFPMFPNGRPFDFFIMERNGQINEAWTAIAAGPDGLVAVGESISPDRPQSWVTAFVADGVVQYETLFAEDFASRLIDVALPVDGRLQVLYRAADSQTTRAF